MLPQCIENSRGQTRPLGAATVALLPLVSQPPECRLPKEVSL